MSCALVNLSWLEVAVPAPSTPRDVCGVVRGNIFFTTEKYPKEKSKPSCMFSTKTAPGLVLTQDYCCQ